MSWHAIHIIRNRWRAQTLARQFLIVATVPIGLNFLVLGSWVGGQVANLVIHQEAAATALYADSFIEPLVQELARGNDLSETRLLQLDHLLANRAIISRIRRVKIWNRDGTIVYSNDEGLRGTTFPLSASLKGALQGRVVAEYDDRDDEENISEKGIKNKLLELYVPVRETSTGRVIAVAETYEIADQLSADLGVVRMQTWLIAAALSLVTLVMLWGIVARGSRTIAGQRQTMQLQIQELGRLLTEVKELRGRVDDAHRRAAESTESVVRRVGSDLHDGPAQSIGLATLHLEELERVIAPSNDGAARAVVERLEELLGDALDEIRRIASGLAPPNLEGLQLSEALLLAASNHEWRSGTRVATQIDGTLPNVPSILKTCIYRFAQEGLNNSFKHAGGSGQMLRATSTGDQLTVEVSDTGPGLKNEHNGSGRPRLGLANMRDRINSLGGRFETISHEGIGTVIRACFELGSGESVYEDHSHRGH